MIVKIAKSERDVIEKNCAIFSIPVRFYTIETNDEMMKAEIGTDDPLTIWHLSGTIGYEKAMADSTESLKKHLFTKP